VAAAGKVPGVDISKLSQLSDFADKELQQSKPTAFSQDSLIEPPPNPLAFQQASQPADIPAPVLPDSQNMSALPPGATPGSAAAAAAEEQQKQMQAMAAGTLPIPMDAAQMMALMPGVLGMADWGHLAVRGAAAAPTPAPPTHSTAACRGVPVPASLLPRHRSLLDAALSRMLSPYHCAASSGAPHGA
jgi:hypothetical protein